MRSKLLQVKHGSTLLFCFLTSLISTLASAQNLFPIKSGNCIIDRFCLDCGDIKANVDAGKLNLLVDSLTKTNNLKKLHGTIMFQILVDSTGKGCVLSHTDASKSTLSKNITNALNSFNGFVPAQSGNNIEPRASFNMSFLIKDEKITAKVERVDIDAFVKSFDRPQNPEIYNKSFFYKNEHLYNYKISVWNNANSGLPNNMNDHIAVDKKGIIWLTVNNGLVKFDGREFSVAEQNIIEKGKYFNYSALAVDNSNIKWVIGKNNTYSYNDREWTMYDSAKMGFDGAYKIVNNQKAGEVFFCTNKGLIIYRDGNWSSINKDNILELPSNDVLYAKRDSKDRIWIGTFNGTAMINENGKVLCFENTNTVLKGKCITSMDEDEAGNLYFSLYEFDRKNKQQVNNEEGIAVQYKDGSIKQFTTANSGMPINHATCVLYDRIEKVLWISTNQAGLVRYNLKDGWENYHSGNSEIPTSYISAMAFDNHGILYLATRQGLVQLKRK